MEQIFEILQDNARATPEQISTMLDIPVSEVEKTIKQAEELEIRDVARLREEIANEIASYLR